jgi:hydrogenase maturation protease
MIRIVGIGSPFGDDGAGLAAARRLAACPPPACDIVIADRPGLGLIDLFAGAEAVILIDAVRSGSPSGTLHDLSLRRLARRVPTPASSHAFGVVAALQIAEQLGRGPIQGRVLGVEISGADGRLVDELTASVRRGVARAVRRARWWAVRLVPSEPTSSEAAGRRARSRTLRRGHARARDLSRHS